MKVYCEDCLHYQHGEYQRYSCKIKTTWTEDTWYSPKDRYCETASYDPSKKNKSNNCKDYTKRRGI